MDDSFTRTLTSTVQTGKDNMTNILNFLNWRNKTSMGCWGSDAANQVTGSDATQFWPGITQQDLPEIFVDNLFRMIQMYSNETKVVKGIKLLTFRIPLQGMMNATHYPPNAAFYQYGHDGVQNMTSCQNGAPVFMSKPHFLDGPWYRTRVNGMHPDRDKHDTNVNIEPTLGTTMQAFKRIQVNLKLLREPLLYPNIQDNLYVPVAWIEEAGELTDKQAEQFKSQVGFVKKAMPLLKYVGIPLGAVFLVAAIALAVKTHRAFKHTKRHEYSSIQ